MTGTAAESLGLSPQQDAGFLGRGRSDGRKSWNFLQIRPNHSGIEVALVSGSMACHIVRERALAAPVLLKLRAHPLRLALVGQPNVGKSVVFGRLTGRYVTVSNYPGTTVAVTSGRASIGTEVCDIIDTPGVNALEGTLSEDERITRELVESDRADLIVQVADARNLRRALMLTSQIAAFDKPVVLVLNMIDEARARGIAIDARRPRADARRPRHRGGGRRGPGPRGTARGDRPRRRLSTPVHVSSAERAAWAHELTDRVRRISPLSLARVQEALGRMTRRPATGLPLLALVLYALYLFVGVFGAQTLVNLLEHDLFGQVVNPAAVAMAQRVVPIGWLRDLFVGQYGLITMGLTYSLAIVLPVVATFFLMFGFLEDSGYIPRLAIFAIASSGSWASTARPSSRWCSASAATRWRR